MAISLLSGQQQLPAAADTLSLTPDQIRYIESMAADTSTVNIQLIKLKSTI